jgi:hypothetical protein
MAETVLKALGWSLLSGLSTGIGGAFIYCFGRIDHQTTAMLLGFSASEINHLHSFPFPFICVQNSLYLVMADRPFQIQTFKNNTRQASLGDLCVHLRAFFSSFYFCYSLTWYIKV